jgi:hypothetical protein
VAEAEQGIAAYFEFYNHERLPKPWVTASHTRSSRKQCSLPSFDVGETPLALIASWRHDREASNRAGFVP